MKKNIVNKKYLIIFGVFALVIVTSAVSFAFFNYSRVGQTTSTIISGDIEFSFVEGENASLANAFPVSDSVGANDTSEEYLFTVKMKSSNLSNKINYNVYLLDDNNDENEKYFKNNQIKFALLKNEVFVAGTSSDTGVKLSEIPGFDADKHNGEGLVLEDQEISTNIIDNYKLRIWISDDVNYSNTDKVDDGTDENNDAQTSTGKYNGYKYSLKVKVTSGTQTSIEFGKITVTDKTVEAEISDPNGLDSYAVTNSTLIPTESEWIKITDSDVTAKSNIKRTSDSKITKAKVTYTVESDGVYYLHVRNNVSQSAKKRILIGKGSTQTINFDSNGGNPLTDVNEISYNDVYGELPTPSRNGYIFAGWYTAPTGGQAVTSTSIYSNVLANKLYARWEKNKYTVTINPNEGTYEGSVGETSYNLNYQDEKNIPEPTRVGYTFDKWIVTGAESEILNGIFKMGYENATLKATWKIDSYTLKVNPNGGTWNSSTESQNFTMEYKSTKEISAPTRDGYTFTGWSISGKNAELNTTTFVIGDGNAELTATWKTNNYKYITKHYQQNVTATGYTLISGDTKEDTEEFGKQVTPPTKTYTGFTSPSPKTLTITSDESKNLVEYQYTRNKYKLTINPNGGKYKNSTSNTEINMYYQASETIENPEKTGYEFKNWTVSRGSMLDKVFTIGSNNATLTANYEAIDYVITFETRGGISSVLTKDVTYDSVYGDLPTPTRAGYSFQGWYTEATGGTKITSDTKVTITANQKLYAHWLSDDASAVTYSNPEYTECTTMECAFNELYNKLNNLD